MTMNSQNSEQKFPQTAEWTKQNGSKNGNSKPSRRRANRRGKRGFSKFDEVKAPVGNAFKLVDRNYEIQREIMPGLICYSSPMYGEIEFNINLDAGRLYKLLKMVLHSWIKTADYTQLRSIRGLIGITASVKEDEALEQLAAHLTTHFYDLVRHVSRAKNFPRYLEEAGIFSMIIPKLAYDLAHIVSNCKRVHKPLGMEGAYVKCSVKEVKLNNADEVLEKLKTKEIPLSGIDSVISFLERIGAYIRLFGTVSINDLKQMNETHPNFLNCIIEESDGFSTNFIIGKETNKRDMLLTYLLQLTISSNTLKASHLQTYSYEVANNRLLGAARITLLQEYAMISDDYIAPAVTELEEQEFENRKSERIVIDS